ncbi:Piso0_002555 [Millerozyma farinosa CBS 7064]|uniref:Piso0_002555 protein n=1 Tax=Pichia sorbitophila (strain ATCC MYA-4447 / BCRC 22081 / CBS 7064 / NBRC 10061 / NRRL Y-12695) TaxID=559304 RepID=G8YCX7_PICSO|nr:Piso0_002555 [Millerozyma farinosa CBS 7064]
MAKSSGKWSLQMATGGMVKYLPFSNEASSVITPDGRYCIVVLTHQMRIYFISTRQCIRTIDIDISKTVDIKFDPNEQNNVLLFQSSGEVIEVNWMDKSGHGVTSVKQIESSKPILSVIGVEKDYYYIISGKTDRKNLYSPHTRHVLRISREDFSIDELIEVEDVTRYSVSNDSTKVAFLKASHEVVIYDISHLLKEVSGEMNGDTDTQNLEYNKDYIPEQNKEVIVFPYKAPVTAIAISNNSIVALGTASGAIQVLYGGLVTDKPQRLLKWHIDQVKSLQFSSDGTYLLSGGLEKVLVFWQLDTDKTQFLPRLNGTIQRIQTNPNTDHYSLNLKVNSQGESQANQDEFYELLVLSSVDLVSRLSVNTIRPNIPTNVNLSLHKTKKKYDKAKSNFDSTKLRHDYSSKFLVHPKTKHLYFPSNAVIQAFDLVKNEQVFIQSAASTLPTGKVRSEIKLPDPSITQFAFSYDGEWMCTYDVLVSPDVDNLLSQDDVQYSLKFWKFTESQSQKGTNTNTKQGNWELCTKIIDPHGTSTSVLSISPAPTSTYSEPSFLTADNRGGVRLWRPRIPKEIYQTVKQETGKPQQTAWTLRKSYSGDQYASDAVDACWSEDGSIIIVGHENTLKLLNSQTFEEISKSIFNLPSLIDSRVRSLLMLGNILVVLSKTRITCFDLLKGKPTALSARVNTTIGGKNLLAVDSVKQIICLAVNYYSEQDGDFGIRSKILLFKPDSLEPIFEYHHDQGISSVSYSQSSFLLVDLNFRVAVISEPSHLSNLEGDSEEEDLVTGMNKALVQARATADLMSYRVPSKNLSHGKDTKTTDIDDSMKTRKTIDAHTFEPIFENLEGVRADSLFERIIKVIR